ncbi:heavy-metal-associated domain-containing protein [Myroides sp. 1354]|uniref:heavy-metal-associated domain-containing protein n=1 Tax=unclassified Myroides TaxID=2642485 RepID=UPI00257869DE|nr:MULTISPECIES: heavy-metal-associated domain-containing protein [unclassified Myroides]MDM1044291.1 heavy-metal-associated domain-containing protein [Myroides sp. R163-1]MDM1055227.1 heavy-metal-associated domain-containing protein [Myroides sp. 1354]MDM1068524.1 heavy-metal-associated domain-containing protein [Myroides sp. 1372]
MKIVKLGLVALLGGAFLVGCKSETKKEAEQVETVEQTETATTETNEVAGNMEQATFQIEGMTCALGCAKMIEGKLSGLQGVKEATVDFESKTATVVFDDAKQNGESLTQTVQKIANGSYTVENLEVKTL